MRLIDIYKESGQLVTLVTAGCIQTGGTLLTRTPNNKFYEMSDGTCACYPCATAKADTVLELECTEAQASAIDAAANRGSLLFAGVRCGVTAEVLHPPRTGYRAFLTGSIEIEKMFACANAYRVRIPIRYDVSETLYRSVTVPVICPELLTISTTSEQVRFFPYRLIDGHPVFVRSSTLFVYQDSLTFTLGFFRADDAETPLDGCTAYISRNSVQIMRAGSLTATFSLALGFQNVDIHIVKNGLRSLRLRLPIYRQAVST